MRFIIGINIIAFLVLGWYVMFHVNIKAGQEWLGYVVMGMWTLMLLTPFIKIVLED